MKSLRWTCRCWEFCPGKLIGCSPKTAGVEEGIPDSGSLSSANTLVKPGTQLIHGISQLQHGKSIYVPPPNIHASPKRDSQGNFNEAESQHA